MNNKKNKILPKLRFPEFEKDGEWNYANGDELFEPIVNKIHNSDLPILAITQEQGAIPREMIDYHVSVSDKSIESYKVVEVGDFIISLRSFQGGIEYSNFLGLCSPAYIILRQKVQIENDFYRHYFKSVTFIRDLNKNLEGIRDGKMISYKQFSEILIPKPNTFEQQKIASCLSSLDELITAETQKLKALQQHKKGLMQNLFPNSLNLDDKRLKDDLIIESTTKKSSQLKKSSNQKSSNQENPTNQGADNVPKLRFKEFENSGEWEIKELKHLGVLVNGLTYSPDDVRSDGLLVLRSSNIQNGEIKLEDNVFVRKDIKGANLSKSNDILICVRNGSKALIGKNALIPDNMPMCTHGAFMTVFRAANPKFVFQLFQTIAYQNQVDADLGATINSINGNNFIKYKFSVPKQPLEQQKIASCLTSLDEIITAQSQKIETLKQHKKGLMQQLFPSITN